MRHAPKFILALAICTQACAASAPVESPKPFDFGVQDGYTFEKNRDVGLAREYWTILRGPNEAYALYPRPDGAPRIAEECAKDTDLSKRFHGLSLCAAATSSAAVERVNSLTRDDALAISTFLHRGLRFRRAGNAIEPHPLTSDIVEVCKGNDELRSNELADVCGFEMRYADSNAPRPDIGYVFTERDLQHLPQALNALYGIDPGSATARGA
jgi:hypothetical protein